MKIKEEVLNKIFWNRNPSNKYYEEFCDEAIELTIKKFSEKLKKRLGDPSSRLITDEVAGEEI